MYFTEVFAVSSGATHIWYDIDSGTFQYLGGPCMFVDQHPHDAGRPELDTIAHWLDDNDGLDAVLEMAAGKEVALIWDAYGQTVIRDGWGEVERVIDGKWVLHERDLSDGSWVVFGDL